MEDFYTEITRQLRESEYGHGLFNVPTPKRMIRYLNNLNSPIFMVIATDSVTTVLWSIRD